MLIDDPALPAAPHLVSDEAAAALATAVRAFGGRLEKARACEVQYRPGRDLVVRYDATVSWTDDAPARRETLLASTTNDGLPDGTVPVEATTESGTTLPVGVWRWPFDPVLPGLPQAVTPNRVASLVRGLVTEPISAKVRAYRPTERAVVQIIGVDSRSAYVKVLPPASIPSLVDRHRQLHAAGVPVPVVLDCDEDAGLLVLAALPGRTLREQLSEQIGEWPTSDAFRAVFAGFARTHLPSATPVRSRASMALGHARMLRTVAPELAHRLADFDEPMTSLAQRSAARAGPVIHGDLYDAQVFSDRSGITGVLDVDDAGPGDPVDDRATVLGFLLVKSIHCDPALQTAMVRYVQSLRQGFVEDVDAVELDHATAAVAVGLATGPFRAQRPDWRADVGRHLDLARQVLTTSGSPAPA
jgi:aminoglycoside phosphotransferase